MTSLNKKQAKNSDRSLGQSLSTVVRGLGNALSQPNQSTGRRTRRAPRRQSNVSNKTFSIGGISGVRTASSFAAAAYSSGQVNREPIISPGNKMTRIVHRELLSTVTGSVAFSVFSSFAVNPGLAATFPWLSTQASGWEQFRFRRLCFEFITRCATTTVGSVILAPDYDAIDAPPSTELQATSYRDTTEDVPWKDQACVLDPLAMHPIGPKKYIRTGLVANSDLKTYDVANMHVCTTGQADSSAIGKLWVCYDVELFVPQTGSGSGPQNTNFAQFNLSANQTVTTATPTTVAYDETITNNLGIVNTLGVFTLPAGNWQVQCESCNSGGTGTIGPFVQEIQKDGASFTIPCLSTQTGQASAAGQLSNHGYVVSTGSTTVRVRVTITSSTGTIILRGDECRVSFTPV